MGNTNNNTASTGLSHFSRRFVIASHPLDREQSIMFFLYQKLSGNKYILKVISTNDVDDRLRIEQLICKKLAKCKNFPPQKEPVTPIDHYIFEQEKGYCNTLNKCYLLFNHKNSEVLSHFLTRSEYNSAQKETINDINLYEGLITLVQGVALLKFYNHPHKQINCDTVYYSPERKRFQLADPWISPLTQFHEQYHAPQKIQQMRNQIDTIDPYIADLFSIGVIGLKVATRQNVQQFYSVSKKTMDLNALNQLADSIQHLQLKNLIKKLLSEDLILRESVFSLAHQNNETKNGLQGSNITKTRNLSGKMSSVRKSLTNQSAPQNQPNGKFGQKLVTSQLFEQNNKKGHTLTLGNPFVKQKIDLNGMRTETFRHHLQNRAIATKQTIPNFTNYSHQNNLRFQPNQGVKNEPKVYFFNSSQQNNGNFVRSVQQFNPNLTGNTTTIPLSWQQNSQPRRTINSSLNNSFQLNKANSQIGNVLTSFNDQSYKTQAFYGLKTQSIAKNQIFHKSPQYEAFKPSPTSISQKDVDQKRTSGVYHSSQQFQADHKYQNKILDNLRALENKVSQVLQSSQISEEGLFKEGFPLDNSRKMVESIIMGKQQESTQKKVDKNYEKQTVETLEKHDKIATQQDRDSPTYSGQELQWSRNGEQRMEMLIVNGDQGQTPQKQKEQKEEDNLNQEITSTPTRNPSSQRLEANNLTIPEESDEESVSQQMDKKNIGQFLQEVYENGAKYVGYMLNGLRNGQGIFYYKDGGYYEGKWKNNAMNGFGKLYYETGKLAYEGQWYQDQFHGRGIVYNDQSVPVGPQGFDYTNMNQYETHWQQYDGDLSHDMKVRFGRLVLSNGQYYEGQFKNDLVHGKGQFHQLDGTIIKGIWKEGTLIKS